MFLHSRDKQDPEWTAPGLPKNSSKITINPSGRSEKFFLGK